MPRTRQFLLLAAVCTVLLGGCQRTEITTETYINKSDSKQTLQLESRPSLKLQLLGRFHGVEMTGLYTQKSDTGTITGTYTYAVDSETKTRKYIFHPQEGESWTGKLHSDGSFEDARGSTWRIQKFVVADVKTAGGN